MTLSVHPPGPPRRGISPVEMMIALVLSLSLVAGMGQLMGSTGRAGRGESAQTQAQETGRLAVEMLGRELRKAGYRTDRQQSLDQLFPAAAPFAAGAVVSGDNQSVTLRFLGSGDVWMRSCLGASVANAAMAVQTLSVVAGELRCRARNLVTGVDSTLPLLSNVEAMDISYGLDADGDGFADSYALAATVSDWTRVASINIQLRTVASEANVLAEPQPYVDVDGQLVTPTDRRLRRNFSVVIALRNRLP